MGAAAFAACFFFSCSSFASSSSSEEDEEDEEDEEEEESDDAPFLFDLPVLEFWVGCAVLAAESFAPLPPAATFDPPSPALAATVMRVFVNGS